MTDNQKDVKNEVRRGETIKVNLPKGIGYYKVREVYKDENLMFLEKVQGQGSQNMWSLIKPKKMK